MTNDAARPFDTAAVGASPAALLMLDGLDRVLTASDGALWLLGRPRATVEGQLVRDVLGFDILLDGELGGSVDSETEVLLRGDRVALAVSVQSIVIDALEGSRLVLLRDVSAEQRRMGDLAFRAEHEPSTRLPNRTAAIDQLRDRLRQRVPMAVVAIELDRLASLVPILGDELIGTLVSVAARRIEQHCRPGDVLAHIGQSQLLVVRPGIDDDEDLLDLVELLVQAVGNELRLGESTFRTRATCGATIAGSLDIAEDVLQDTLLAMRHAVHEQLDVARFTTAMRHAEQRQLLLERALDEALNTNGLELHLQPVVDLASERVVSYEALARWSHPSLGRIGPDEFIPLAERVGLIRRIGEWALESALVMIERWREMGAPVVPIAINLSPSQLLDSSFIDLLTDAVTRHAAAGAVSVEVTEGVLASPGAVDTLHELSARGMTIAIDDFGTGFSALSYLAAMPASVVKIDRSFVLRLEESRTRVVVDGIIALAHRLGLRVIAEGVESEDVLQELRRLGCDAVQGYHTGAPAPFEHWLERAVVPQQEEDARCQPTS
jgi:EAL domain-containing protein (putative c-di-GMP-specific phosphodiesterase class I)/GGDEF domain-containing protein